MDLGNKGLLPDWEYKDESMSEGEWSQEWIKAYPEISTNIQFKIGDIVEYYGKRCKIVDDSGIDNINFEEYFLLEIIDENEKQKMTWWASKNEISPWRGARTLCECGAIHVKGSENLHSHWCPAYKRKD